MKRNENNFPLERAYGLSEGISLLEENNKVFIVEKMDHKIQNILRKLTFKIPENKYTELDEYGSVILPDVRNNKTVLEIATSLRNTFGEKAEPLYERLMPYLIYLEKKGIIKRLDD